MQILIALCSNILKTMTVVIFGGPSGLEIDISRQWSIGPPVLEIWWSCQISGGPDVANRQYVFVKSNTADMIYLFLLCTKHLNNTCNT